MSKDGQQLWGGAHAQSDGSGASFAAASDTMSKAPAESAIVAFDIQTNLAHIESLLASQLITKDEHAALKQSLTKLQDASQDGSFVFDASFEDIHSQIEASVINDIGETGKKLHTARSRNDQVTTDMFLFNRAAATQLQASLGELCAVLEQQADQYKDVLAPGFTHQQPATITTYGAMLNAFNVMFKRDLQRLANTAELFDYSPLGAGNGFESLLPLDASVSAKELGFAKAYESAIDVVYNRGEYEATLAGAISHFFTHASMLAQTTITFSTPQYGMISISDSYTTGSSVMPHKRNPDVFEVIRGKAVAAHATASAISQLRQGAFIGFNRDTQESKRLIVELVAEAQSTMAILTQMQSGIIPQEARMKELCNSDFITITGFMELIIQEKNVPMRSVKQLIEKVVAEAMSKNEQSISFELFTRHLEESDLDIAVSEAEFNDWLDPEFQYRRIRRRP